MVVVIAIPSVINITREDPNNISNNERYKQTVEQLESIKKYSPEALIIVADGSISLPMQWKNTIISMCNIFLQCGNTPEGVFKCHIDKNKNAGEKWLMLNIYDVLQTLPYSTFIKFGGRYKLQPSFNLRQFTGSNIVVRAVEYLGKSEVEPVLYSIPKDLVDDFFLSLRLQLCSNRPEQCMERFLRNYTTKYPYRLKTLKKLDIEGYSIGHKKFREL